MLLIGDVALAHDVGGLLAARRLGLKLTIVLIDNDGGGHLRLPPGQRRGRRLRASTSRPRTGSTSPHAAALYGCGFERAEDLEGFRAALGARSPPTATTIVSVRTEREANVRLHRDVWAAVAASVREGA